MAFEEIVGQERIVEILKKTLLNNTFSHAYLFEGLEGLGKKQMALEFAKGVICSQEGMKPCNVCQTCRRIQEGNYPEVNLIQEDGTIKIEKIRELQKDIQMKPYEGRKKIYIINHAENMTVQAQNALLKTLEEPPAYATIILLTVNGNSLLPTIISRCQILKFRPVEIGKIQQVLMEGRGVSREESRMVSSFSNGIIGRALKLLEDEDFKRIREEVLKLTEEMLRRDTINLLESVDFFTKEKNQIEEILDMLVSWYRDLMIYKETQELHFLMNCDRIEEIQDQSNRIGLKKIRDIIFIIDQTKGNIKSNVNFQLNIEVMLLNIQEVLVW
ncbi:DNA polymerase III subunit delta' [Alkaliphilus hydrothermalis]|uniref:DNA polymerase III subunit delta' n=1 Tax=Alkaliphilus hydrothermalis TaxID=1482730 RepID=A0ABS2NQ57_9FIRM|nr:DNA polymerase III subunit delta' [Alkaliphilus hydrothermalis]MBM7614739.1 DNA polymerase-3 subunit delta' [Alkaliphilus hydrothermalis]